MTCAFRGEEGDAAVIRTCNCGDVPLSKMKESANVPVPKKSLEFHERQKEAAK